MYNILPFVTDNLHSTLSVSSSFIATWRWLWCSAEICRSKTNCAIGWQKTCFIVI